MHYQRESAQHIIDAGGHYVLTVKANQRTLRATLKDLPWSQVPGHTYQDKDHGRRVTRTIKAIEVPAWVDWPGAAQVAQIRRTRTIKGRKHVEVVYVICSLSMLQASPRTMAAWVQGHWGIENRLHWVRDVIFDEDRHQLRTGHGPQVPQQQRDNHNNRVRETSGSPLMRQHPDHAAAHHTLTAAATTPPIILEHPTGKHRLVPLQPLPGHHQPQLIQPSESMDRSRFGGHGVWLVEFPN